jgi:hypothetical protein
MDALEDLNIDMYTTAVVNPNVGKKLSLAYNAKQQTNKPTHCCFFCKTMFTRKESLVGM